MKHLVYLCDGTWMFPGSTKSNTSFTNIHRLNNRLEFLDRDNMHQQFVYYSRGLGSGHTYFKVPQGVFGWGIWNDIEELYLNVCSNYDPKQEDLLYIFGFSRGSIVARVAAGLLSYGVLRLQSFDHISDIRTLYLLESKAKRGKTLSAHEQAELEKARKAVEENIYAKKPNIEFLGLFDSVIGGDKWVKTFQELGVVESRPADNVKVTVQILALGSGPIDRLEAFLLV